jgi:hypothetical protein
MTFARIALATVGVVSILMSLLGFWYNGHSLSADFSQLQHQQDFPHFYPAFYTMTAICVLFYLLLLYIGVQFIRGDTGHVRLFTLVLIAEILYFFAVGVLWLLPEYGRSIAAATGVANGGLSFQAFVFFPIWAPLTAYFASRSIRHANVANEVPQST